MDSLVSIEFWEDKHGSSPPSDFFNSLPAEAQVMIVKKNDFISRLRFHELRMHQYFTKVKGVDFPLYELRYVGARGNNFRMLCFQWDNKLIGLEMFKGSGSGGRVRKYCKVALQRAEDWKHRF